MSFLACEMNNVLTIVAAFVVLLMVGCERSVTMVTLDQTAADIFDGTIAIDENGKCTIDAKNNAIENVAYVTTLPDGSKIILFRTWQGKGSNLRGIIYTNGPPLTAGSEVEVMTSQLTEPAGGPPIERVDVLIDSAITNSCYRVSRSLD